MFRFLPKTNHRNSLAAIIDVGVVLFAASGCSAMNKPTPTVTPTPSLTSTFTPSYTPTLTHTSTPTNTPTNTETPTITLTPTPIYNGPGTYPIKNKCNSYILTVGDYGHYPWQDKYYTGTVTFCLTYVFIDKGKNMTFGMYYVIVPPSDWGGDVQKGSDANNHEIILIDDLKNGYKFLQSQGCAVRTHVVAKSCDGWYLFPPAKPGAKSFVLIYPIQGRKYTFENIVLINPN
jgi:hypothetical protein